MDNKTTFQNRFERVKDILASSFFFSNIQTTFTFVKTGASSVYSGCALLNRSSSSSSLHGSNIHTQTETEGGVHDHDKRLISLSKAVSQGTSLSHLMAKGIFLEQERNEGSQEKGGGWWPKSSSTGRRLKKKTIEHFLSIDGEGIFLERSQENDGGWW